MREIQSICAICERNIIPDESEPENNLNIDSSQSESNNPTNQFRE